MHAVYASTSVTDNNSEPAGGLGGSIPGPESFMNSMNADGAAVHRHHVHMQSSYSNAEQPNQASTMASSSPSMDLMQQQMGMHSHQHHHQLMLMQQQQRASSSATSDFHQNYELGEIIAK